MLIESFFTCVTGFWSLTSSMTPPRAELKILIFFWKVAMMSYFHEKMKDKLQIDQKFVDIFI